MADKPKKRKQKYPYTHAKPRRRTPKSTDDMPREKIDKWRKENKAPSAKSVWLKNSKRTTEVIFSTPHILMEEFENYVKFCKAHPWKKTDFKIYKGRPVKVEIPIEKPVTLGGFLVFCGVGDHYWKNFRAEVAPRNAAYGPVIDYIIKTTREQNIEGAYVGTYNGNLVSRVLGLAENVNTHIDDQRQVVADVFPKKFKSPNK